MKKLLILFLFIGSFGFSQTTEIPMHQLVNNYTNATEATFASTLVNIPNGGAVIYNTDLQKIRIWNGTAFADSPPIPVNNIPAMTAPVLGAATGTSLTLTGNLTTSAGSIGYATGAGGTITQITSRSTGVTLNKICGAITTTATSLAAGAEAVFVVTDNLVAIGDVVLISTRSGQTALTSVAVVSQVTAVSFSITITNLSATTADTGAMTINFIILKAVSN